MIVHVHACAIITLLLEVACDQCTVVVVGWLRFGLVCGYSEGLGALSTQMCTLLLVYTHVHVFTLLACACKG